MNITMLIIGMNFRLKRSKSRSSKGKYFASLCKPYQWHYNFSRMNHSRVRTSFGSKGGTR